MRFRDYPEPTDVRRPGLLVAVREASFEDVRGFFPLKLAIGGSSSLR